jgi:hypothetical protein
LVVRFAIIAFCRWRLGSVGTQRNYGRVVAMKRVDA